MLLDAGVGLRQNLHLLDVEIQCLGELDLSLVLRMEWLLHS